MVSPDRDQLLSANAHASTECNHPCIPFPDQTLQSLILMSESPADNQPCLWTSVRDRAAERAAAEPLLASFLYSTILNHDSLQDAVSYHLASKLSSDTLPAMQLRQIMQSAMTDNPEIVECICADIVAVRERDPAVNCTLVPLLFMKGVHALAAWRFANWLWHQNRELMAVFLQNRISEMFTVDIHPAARIGRGIFIDHATSVIIGETAVIEDDVSMLHEVTLGGTGKTSGDRHPKVRKGVLIGAGAKILGNVEIGAGAKIGAGSVVLHDIPPHCTAAGVPAVIVGKTTSNSPAHDMNHQLDSQDNA